MSFPIMHATTSTLGPDGAYAYTSDLLALHSANANQATPTDHRIAQVYTPLNIPEWQACLHQHSDTDFASYILSGLQNGFRIGVAEGSRLHSAKSNMQSAKQHAQVIHDYLAQECQEGNIFGPFNPQTFPHLHINRFGVIPKKRKPGEWRLITDLSSPEGASVNDGIDSSLCSLAYISVKQVAETALQLGPGSLLAKIDIKSAYRLVPVHPLDRYMLGMEWDGQVYVDGMLPFGLQCYRARE